MHHPFHITTYQFARRMIITVVAYFVVSYRLVLLALRAFLLHALTPNKVSGLLFDATESLAIGIPVCGCRLHRVHSLLLVLCA
jgi:hypothetical protein